MNLSAATGLRIGELGLRWSVLVLEGGSLAVRESAFDGKPQSPETRKLRSKWDLLQEGKRGIKAIEGASRPTAAMSGPVGVPEYRGA